jgi:mRNA-degrading endonuclease toxin of MazEF toxin-antitoxin module
LGVSQFDVFANPERSRQPNVPCVVVIQSDHFVNAKTTVVVPLLRIAQPKIVTAVNPQFVIGDDTLTLEPFQLAFIPTRLLAQRLGNLEEQRHLIIRAMDALMSGL